LRAKSGTLPQFGILQIWKLQRPDLGRDFFFSHPTKQRIPIRRRMTRDAPFQFQGRFCFRLGGLPAAEVPRVQGPSEPADNSALARRIPSFEDDNGSFSGAKICLLDRLHDGLHRLQPALVVFKPDCWMPGNFIQRGTFDDNKIFRFHPLDQEPAVWPAL